MNKKIATLLLSLCTPFINFYNPASALGELTIERQDGDVQVYSDIEISQTKDVIYFHGGENKTILMVEKDQCKNEGDLLVCNTAKVSLQSYGVLEDLNVQEIFVFINSSRQKQSIKGSTVIMSPQTVVLEFLTDKGTFISAFGEIDYVIRPAGALK